MFGLFKSKKPESRSVENPQVPISNEAVLEFFGIQDLMGDLDITVNSETAMGVPAIWCAVNFISSTIASLPLNVYKKTKEGREKISSGIGPIFHDAVNDECTSFDWRKYGFERTLTGGRQYTYIERTASGRLVNLWPLDPKKTKPIRKGGRKYYVYRETGKKPVTYEAADIIDIPFMLDSTGVRHLSPINTHKETIALAIAAKKYGTKFFSDGGVPPFVLMSTATKGGSLKRASDDLEAAVRQASKERRLALTLPLGHDIKSLGANPEDSQMIDSNRFIVEEVARIYSLPPAFLQDLTNGTFNNTEQQDLHLVKHTIRRWVVQSEQEINLKVFGRSKNNYYVEYNLDGLMRGDFKTRMEGYATGIQNAVLKPNEARAMENRAAETEGDKLLIQGATVPLGSQPNSGDTDD